MLNDRNGLTDISFSTILCLIIFLLLAIKAGFLFHSHEEQGAELQSEKTEKNETIPSLPNSGEDAEDGITVIAKSQNTEEPEVSVLITNSSGGSKHENVRVTGTADFVVSSSAGTDTFSFGDSVDLASYFTEKNISSCSFSLLSLETAFSDSASLEINSAEAYSEESIEEIGKSAKVAGIQVLSLEKGGISPVYPGTLYIQWDSQKQDFYVINELNLESYLPGVISSEMPDSFGLEALKTQAVCARSYALSVIEAGEIQSAENGDVSWYLVDTTDDQVYMSGTVDALAVIACEQTRGQILIQNNSPMKPHYYSTSWGEQADGGVFSGEEPQILEAAAAVSQTQDEILKMNETFIHTYELLERTDSGENASYDLESPWFRWTSSISLADLCEKAVKAIAVTERGTGGYASKLLISYEDGTAEQISGAKAIRERLGAETNLYQLNDGSTRNGLSILPSAFFYLDAPTEENGVSVIRIYGGGFGHGYGMSQYGAAKMAETGHKYTEILSYYYKSAQICEYY